jgi:hypothetical protein
MKHVIAFATISACLLVLSGGAALANGSGHPNSVLLGTGQPGGSLAPGAQCGLNAFNPPPGQTQAGTLNNSSPFLDGLGSAKVYAGAGANPNSNSGNAFSNYDVACSQKRPGQLH